MIDALAPLLNDLQLILWSLGLVFVRVGAMMFVLPAFGEQSIPTRIKLALAFAFTLIVAPVVTPDLPDAPLGFAATLVQAGPEVVTGLAFGLLLRFFVFALQVAGTMAAQSTSLSQIFGGTAGVDPMPAIGHVLVVSGLALAALLGLHVAFASYIVQSFALVPFGVAMAPEALAQIGSRAVADTFALAFKLAAPFMIASLLYNVVLGVINKAMPQLMVSFVGAPAITAGSLVILFLAAPAMLSIWVEAFSRAVMFPGVGLP